MRAGDLVTELAKHTAGHDWAVLLFQFKDSNVPLFVEFGENVETALAGGWIPTAILFKDTVCRVEHWGGELLAGGDEAFMQAVLQQVAELRAEQFSVPWQTTTDELDA